MERHTRTEVEKRVVECYSLRYEKTPPIKYYQWLEYCHTNYGDRSERQYYLYWEKAKDRYQEGWKERLGTLLQPAVDEITSLLADPDPKVRQKAVEHVFKYTGNDVTKIDANVNAEIKITFGNPEPTEDDEEE